MKVIVSKIKIYREPRVEGMTLIIKSVIWNTREKKACNQNIKKKNSKNDRLSSLWNIFKFMNI